MLGPQRVSLPDRQRFAVAPQSVGAPHPLIPVIVSSLERLAARQNRDGSWGRGAVLDRLICTCHVTMALQAGGYGLTHPTLVAAKQWLCSPEADNHNNSYWIAGPLAAWAATDPHVAQLVGRKLDVLSVAIEGHAQPHPDQFMQYFYINLAFGLPEPRDMRTLSRFADQIKAMWNPSDGIAHRADTTSVAFAALEKIDPAFAAEIRADVVRLMQSWAHNAGSSQAYWRNPVSTAYTIMNWAESSLSEQLALNWVVEQSVSWLQARQRPDGLWESDMPYGGQGDITSLDYPTAAIVRALIAYASTKTYNIQAAIADVRLARSRQRLWRQQRTMSLLVLLIVILIGILLGPPLYALLAQWVGAQAANILAILGVLITTAAWVFPRAGERAIRWIGSLFKRLFDHR